MSRHRQNSNASPVKTPPLTGGDFFRPLQPPSAPPARVDTTTWVAGRSRYHDAVAQLFRAVPSVSGQDARRIMFGTLSGMPISMNRFLYREQFHQRRVLSFKPDLTVIFGSEDLFHFRGGHIWPDIKCPPISDWNFPPARRYPLPNLNIAEILIQNNNNTKVFMRAPKIFH